MLYFIKNDKLKELIVITIVFFVSQGFLLVVSGRWWDDWVFYLQEDYALKLMSHNMGRPSLIFIIEFLKLFPEPFYRYLTFIMYFYCSLLFYRILEQGYNIEDNMALWLTMLLITTPVNTDRVMICIFPYTIGLFFFILGMNFFINYYNVTDGIIFRSISLLCFLFSFILNSNIFFYGLLFILIILKKRNLYCLLNYVDFILLPIVFFLLKNRFFPTAGAYQNYNTVNFFSLINGILLLPFSACILFINTIKNYFNYSVNITIAICVIILFIVLFLNLKKIYLYLKKILISNKFTDICIETKEKIGIYILFVLIGVLLLLIGVYPYVVVRQSIEFSTGRDAILSIFGMSFILYGTICLLFKSCFKYSIMLIFIVLGIIYFNIAYLKYQKGFYQIKGLQYQIYDNNSLSNCGNNLLLNMNETFYGNNDIFYVLNKAYFEVSGKQDKLILKKDGLGLLQQNKFDDYLIESHNYGMNEYVYEDDRIDAVLDYSFNCSLLSTIKLKLYEMILPEMFVKEIESRSNLIIYEYGTDGYNKLIN